VKEKSTIAGFFGVLCLLEVSITELVVDSRGSAVKSGADALILTASRRFCLTMRQVFKCGTWVDDFEKGN
jgi:hypothetical protein